ncbi:ArsR/SmtB family transcription factor [Cuniculiplasma sp. SKW3]|uniref:ArsR/SmtB family transcription factor n=1 Tax=Cuniculiplasma sp. SKW3 TaxID=3400170 RepID=UPI003FCF209F
MNQCKTIDNSMLRNLKSIFSDPGNARKTLVHKALGDQIRLGIYEILLREELCVCQLEEITELPQSTVSGALKVLLNAGLISGRREGKWIYYHAEKNIMDKWIIEVTK